MILLLYQFLSSVTLVLGFIFILKSKNTKKMQKTPLEMAIDKLKQFEENVSFSKEAQSAVDGSISILKNYLEIERTTMITLINTFFMVMYQRLNNGEIDYVNENVVEEFLNLTYTKDERNETPTHGSYEHLQSLGRGRSKN